MAALSFPSFAEAGDRRKAAIAWCASFLRECIKIDPTAAEELARQFPQYFDLTDRDVRRALRKTRKRLQTLVLAGKMSRGYFHENTYETPAVLPESMARLSINELSRLILAEAHQSDPHNVEKRIWVATKPVIHLASAYDLLARKLAEDQGGYHLDDLETHQSLIAYGEWAEQIVLGDKRFGVTEKQLLRIRIR